MRALTAWTPSLVMGLAAVFAIGIDTQRSVPLRAPLGDAIPWQLDGYVGRDVTISDEVLKIAGVTNYLLRDYESQDDQGRAGSFSLYVGYYDRQVRGKTIHSPKNCLPGTGWEVLASTAVTIAVRQGPAAVNRYVLQKDNQRALVLYWYQGRGRLRANEYLVKLDLLRDGAFRKRTEEALVRIVVPIVRSEAESFALAARVAAAVAPALQAALPSWSQS